MGIQDLQKFLETHCQQACKPVDLVQIARGIANKPIKGKRRPGPGPAYSLKLIVDAESCLDRLYGGYFSDWVCGGQWNRMTNFLTTLMQACHTSNMDLVVFLNGAFESTRLQEWNKQQRKRKSNISHVIRHISNKGTPPPKVWWVPPACLLSSLRMALRQLGVPVMCSTEDHHQEVMAYCRENFFHGIVAQDADYAIFDPPRYFSSEHLKLTYKGSLETQEYVMDDVARALDLHPKRFALLATLLGTHFIPEEELREFYSRICNLGSPAEAAKLPSADIIKAVVSYVRGLVSIDDVEAIGREVFRNATGNIDDKVSRFKQSVHYYVSGTQEGFLKYKPKTSAPSPVKQPGSYLSKQDGKKKLQVATDNKNVYTQGESGYGDQPSGDIPPQTEQTPTANTDADAEAKTGEQTEKALEEKLQDMTLEKTEEDTSPETGQTTEATDASESKGTKKVNQAKRKPDQPVQSSAEVLRIAQERHQQGLMAPWVYQLLTCGEIKVPVTLEEEMSRELPSALEVYRPIRQRVYAVLFDLHKKLAEYRKATKNAEAQGQKVTMEKPQVVIREWVVPPFTSANTGLQCDMVRAVPLEWIVPGTQRLWMGQMPDDKGRRLKTFLGCMTCDVNGDDNLLVNTSYVPQHLVILCTVLRHMLLFCRNGMHVLRKHELDAFLATAVSPLLHDVETMQEMKLPNINNRGVQLASLLMRGVEHAIFANDACGAPIPWHMCCPWLFFDGKLFHFKLLKAMNNTPLMDICDGHLEQVMRVERMRQAILQGVMNPDMVFAKPVLPLMQHPFGPSGMAPPMYQQNTNIRPPGAPVNPPNSGPGPRGMGRGRGLLGRSPVDSRGGQLQIAGVVVGSWGGNTQSHNQRAGRMTGGPNSQAPQVMSVGPRRGMNRGVVSTRVPRGGGRARFSSSVGRGPGRMQQPYYNQNYDSNFMDYDNDINQRPVMRGRFRGNGRSAGQSRGQFHGNNQGQGRPQGPGQNFPKVTLEQRNKAQGNGIGRGCTIENPSNGNNVNVSEMLRSSDAGSTQAQQTSHAGPPAGLAAHQEQTLAAGTTHTEQGHQVTGRHQQVAPPSLAQAAPPNLQSVAGSHQSSSHPTQPLTQSHHVMSTQQQPSMPAATVMSRAHGIPGGLQTAMPGSIQSMGDMGQFEDPQAQAQFNATAAAMIEMNKMASQMVTMPTIPGMTPPNVGPIHMNGNMGTGEMQ